MRVPCRADGRRAEARTTTTDARNKTTRPQFNAIRDTHRPKTGAGRRTVPAHFFAFSAARK